MYLIVGLGNPGAKYQNNRHNLGFKVIEELAQRLGISVLKEKCHAFIGQTKIADHRVILAQPQTFMNSSGLAVRGLLNWFKIDTKNLVLIYDDVDLEVGGLRLREKGGAGGHHGVESVIESIETTAFPRVRIGVGRENLTDDVTEYVLQDIPSEQQETLEQAVVSAADAIETIIAEGLALAMSKFNK